MLPVSQVAEMSIVRALTIRCLRLAGSVPTEAQISSPTILAVNVQYHLEASPLISSAVFFLQLQDKLADSVFEKLCRGERDIEVIASRTL